MLVELAGNRLLGGVHNRPGLLLGQPAGRLVDERARLLHVAIGVIDRLWHPVTPDREVVERALGLRAPVSVGRHVDFAHAVEFLTLAGRVNADWNILYRRMVCLSMGHRRSLLLASNLWLSYRPDLRLDHMSAWGRGDPCHGMQV